MTIYLTFSDRATALAALGAENYRLGANMCSGNGWGWMGVKIAQQVASTASPSTAPAPILAAGFHVTLHDCDTLAPSLVPFRVAAPLIPFNHVAGREIPTVYGCIVLPTALRTQMRALITRVDGDTHDDLCVKGLSANGVAPATHYIIAGHFLRPFARLFTDAQLLADAANRTLAQAQTFLAQLDVSRDRPREVLTRLGLEVVP